MTDALKIHRGRTMLVPVSLSYDVTPDTYTSQIRKARDVNSPLIATFTVTKPKPTELLCTLDDSVTAAITAQVGWWDIKRVVGGEPFNVFEEPVPVIFLGVVTA